ncbi:hypothetical protein [Dyadobacter sp. CY356]|uniref:hypothetical protein n=1 Tax=Dyadobacter sp. CY356 TaxID=2906442 RepID=UPI001F1583C1|nr:hypothetical protein [Dyadobacter sp. CY356]MCF0054655.1 hypothetical protein [Dyadobacter sp. CY356]
MKKLSRLFVPFLFVLLISSCNKDSEDVVAIDNTTDYQKAINAKFIAMGWDKDGHVPLNGSTASATTAKKGYVQYYTFGNEKTAIFYFEGKGAFVMNSAELKTYEAANQDKYAIITSDPKSCGTGCGYNDMITVADNAEGIILLDFIVSGEFYKKYKALNRWDGALGIPAGNQYNWTTKEFVQTYKSQKFSKASLTVGITYPTNEGPVAIDQQFYSIWEETMKNAGARFFADWPLGSTQVSPTGKRYQRFRWFTMYQGQNPANTSIFLNGIYDNYFKTVGYENSSYGPAVSGWPTWVEAGKYYQQNYANGKWIKCYIDTQKYDFSG